MAKTCVERFNQVKRIGRLLASFCGADVFGEVYNKSFLTWFVISAINAYFACTIYTIYIGFVVNGDWKIILESLSLAGSAIQGYSKLICGITARSLLRSMLKKLEDIYKEYQEYPEFLPVLRHRINLTTKVLKMLISTYIVSLMVVNFYPIIYGVLTNQRILIMKFYLPGIDPTTDTGHLIHNVVHGTLIFLGAFGNFAGDIFTFVLVIHVPLWKDVLKVKIEKLNTMVLGAASKKETITMLKDIVAWHQGCNIYAQQVEKAFFGVIFVQVSTSVIGISCTIFSIIIRSWPAAFMYLLYSTGILYAFCGLGHLVEVSNDEIVDIIYGDILWYNLAVAEQKLVLLMLRKSQMPVKLTIGNIMPLSMSTALQLTKTIYSYMMMLINFLEMDEM